MKKKIISALMAALVVGAASTTFAAEIDDSVKELRDRVTELERDSQYNRNRVAELERDNQYNRMRVNELEDELADRNSGNDWADKFKITGEMRYRFWGIKNTPDVSTLQLRLFPTFQIDDTFTVKSRLTASYNMSSDTGGSANMTYAYLEGNFDNFTVNAGKMPLFTHADGGLIADDFFSGVQFIGGADALKLYVNGGHWNGSTMTMTQDISPYYSLNSRTGEIVKYEPYIQTIEYSVGKGDYIGAEATYDLNDELQVGAGYHYIKSGSSKAQIAAAGGTFKLAEDWGLNAAVAHNSKAGSHKTAYNIEGTYLGAERDVVGSWGAFAAYRYIGGGVGIAPTYDSYGQTKNKKGFDIGATYTPYENTLLKLSYFHGKSFYTGHPTDRTIFARASLFF